MKKLRNLIIYTLLIMGFITSCKKEENFSQETTESLTYDPNSIITGDEIQPKSKDELGKFDGIHEMKLEKMHTSIKKLNKNLSLNHSNARSRAIHPIECGTNKLGDLYSENNTSNIGPGADRIYKLVLTKKDEVKIALDDLTTDMDIYLCPVIQDSYGRESIGSIISSSENYGTNDELIDWAILNSGEYFLIVEAYDGEGSFRISLSCKGSNILLGCENFEKQPVGYAANITKLSNFWTLWNKSYPEADGKVLYESATIHNKVVKFDRERFGYQDVIRSLVGLPITGGIYEINFKMYVPANYESHLVTEKTKNGGDEQGISISVANGRYKIKYRGKDYMSNVKKIHDQWLSVRMIFDLKSKKGYFMSNGIFLTFRTDAIVSRNEINLNSIFGINFYTSTRNYNTKFHIDNVCVKEYVSGFDDPAKMYITAGADQEIEVMDLIEE